MMMPVLFSCGHISAAQGGQRPAETFQSYRPELLETDVSASVLELLRFERDALR